MLIKRDKYIVNSLFKDIIPDNLGYIAGGYARYLISKDKSPAPAGDIDIYSLRKENYDLILENCLEYGLNAVYESEFATTFDGFDYQLQVIKPITEVGWTTLGRPKIVTNCFDLSVAQVAVTSPTAIYTSKAFERTEKTKSLKLISDKIRCPITTANRVIKYCSKGYRISILELAQLFCIWSEQMKDEDVKTFSENLHSLEATPHVRSHETLRNMMPATGFNTDTAIHNILVNEEQHTDIIERYREQGISILDPNQPIDANRTYTLRPNITLNEIIDDPPQIAQDTLGDNLPF